MHGNAEATQLFGNIMKKLFTNLSFWVLIAIVAGVWVGHYQPDWAKHQVLSQTYSAHFLGQELKLKASLGEMLSSGFISLVKLFINPIIFLTIMLGIISMGNLKKVGRVGLKSLLYFEVVTTFALIIGVVAAWLLQPGAGVDHSSVTAGNLPAAPVATSSFSWMQFLRDNSTLQTLLLALVLGIGISLTRFALRVEKFLKPISLYVFKALHRVMLLAPLGAFGGMAFTISAFGIDTLMPLGKLMLTMYITMAFFIFGVLFLVLRYYRISLWQFLKYIREELLIVLGTSSSEAALPSLMEKLERMGCSKPVVGLVVPTGYSFNLDGTTIYLSMCVLFLSQVFNVNLSIAEIGTVIGVLMLTSKGAAGVTGSGFVVLASTLTAVKVVPIEGLALLLGIDRFMSEGRAITNFIGNGVAAIWMANHEKEFDRSKMEFAFSRVSETENVLSDNIDASTVADDQINTRLP